MGAIITYFRDHPWQRRLATGSLAAVVGALAAVILVPMWRDHKLLKDLASTEPAVRTEAIMRGVRLASFYPSTRQRFQQALWSDDDRRFAGAAEVLNRLDLLERPGSDPNIIDRFRLIQVRTTRLPGNPQSAAESRRLAVHAVIMSGHDNDYVRRTLAIAAADPAPTVRCKAALLAAKLKDANTLQSLLRDGDANVVASAALDAGLARMPALGEAMEAALTQSRDPQVISACVYALSGFAVTESVEYEESASTSTTCPSSDKRYRSVQRLERLRPLIRSLFRDANSEILRDRLLHVVAITPGEEPCILDWEDIREGAQANALPSAMAILAWRHYGAPISDPMAPPIGRILSSAAAQDGSVTESQAIAALQVSDTRSVPVRGEVLELCRRLWSSDHPLMLTVAAGVLGGQAELGGQAPNAPSRQECIDALRQAATYRPAVAATQPASSPADTPLPSAAAAVALWLIEPSASFVKAEAQAPPAGQAATKPAGQSASEPASFEIDPRSSAFYVQAAAASESYLPADYIAWRLARSGRPEAFELGLALLPPPLDPNLPPSLQPPRTYSQGARATGAMLLALAARDERHKQIAIARLSARLQGGPVAAKPPFIDAMTYQCALLALGQSQYRDGVFNALLTGAFPMRRAATALMAAGDGQTLDWLLCDARESDADLADTIIRMTLWEPLAAAASLPRIDLAASPDLRTWQTRIIRDAHILGRKTK